MEKHLSRQVNEVSTCDVGDFRALESVLADSQSEQSLAAVTNPVQESWVIANRLRE